jgi:hypothetical protein
MAGDIKLNYVASSALTDTGLQGLAASATWEAGWTSNAIDNRTNEYADYLLSGTFTTHATHSAGVINVYVYAALNDTPTWPDIFSSGTEGSVGAATVTDTEQRDSAMRFVASMTTDTGASEVYTFPPTSIAMLFGGVIPPEWAVFVTQSTAANLAASGSALYITPVNYQYT